MSTSEFGYQIPADLIEQENRDRKADLEQEYEALGESLRRAETLKRLGTTLDQITEQVSRFEVAIPSWGLCQGGTRFGRFPLPGEPTDIFEKLVDAATIHRLSGATSRVALHIPWDRVEDRRGLLEYAGRLGLVFDAMNSNTFQDQPKQPLSYKFGSLCHTRPEVRAQAIEHNLSCIEFGKAIGSEALNIWIGDGGCFPGQVHFRRSLERTMESLREIYRGLPASWRLFVEYKPFEPAFYSTVIQDWGTAYIIASDLGEQASCLVDLGHHLPNTNVEQVVSRLIGLGKLGGFHFNDSKFADDDLTTGSMKPYQLFLIFCELVDAESDPRVDKKYFQPAYMVDQSHNLKDPVEELIQTVEEIRRAYAKALLVDRDLLSAFQEKNDVISAEMTLKQAYETDVRPILAMARARGGSPIDPLAVFRQSRYRQEKAREREARSIGGFA